MPKMSPGVCGSEGERSGTLTLEGCYAPLFPGVKLQLRNGTDGLLLEDSGNQIEMSGQVRRPADVNEISKEVRVQPLS